MFGGGGLFPRSPYPPPSYNSFLSPQGNFNVDYMFSAASNQTDHTPRPMMQQSFMQMVNQNQQQMVNQNQQQMMQNQQQPMIQSSQQPMIQNPQPMMQTHQQPMMQNPQPMIQTPQQLMPPPFMPTSPRLTAVRPQQPPSVLGHTKVETPTPVDTTKTTIVPLMNPVREQPTSHHQRGLSSVVHNTSVVEDNSTEDEEDYEARIESNELKTDEKVKKKVMSALQSALSNLQLTGIQIKWSDIEVDDRIGVGGFAIVYHGMYRCVSFM